MKTKTKNNKPFFIDITIIVDGLMLLNNKIHSYSSCLQFSNPINRFDGTTYKFSDK